MSDGDLPGERSVCSSDSESEKRLKSLWTPSSWPGLLNVSPGTDILAAELCRSSR